MKKFSRVTNRIPLTGFSVKIIVILFLFCLLRPMPAPFKTTYSNIAYDRNGHLLRASLTKDEQYRFPPGSALLPEKYIKAVICFEDKRFFSHQGIDPLALMRAAFDNLRSGSIQSGGSTIPMQVMRLSNPKPRTIWNKMREAFQALRLSVHFSKEEILEMYAAHVPLGGNVEGIHAACYKFFGKPPADITWAEAALLAVLPNAPSTMNLNMNRKQLKNKRDKLLDTMASKGMIDDLSAELGAAEPIPETPDHMPFYAPHAVFEIFRNFPGAIHNTTLDIGIQSAAENLAGLHYKALSDQGIENAAVLVAETRTGYVRAYIGSQNYHDILHSGRVDGVQAFRSTGSLLKPFLAAKALDRGPWTMQSLLQDVPTFFGSFRPQNATKTFQGLATMEEMLIQSLNVPAVRLLNHYGLHDFYYFLQSRGLKGLFRGPDGYGLPLIIGGAEASLWELCALFASLGNLGEAKNLSLKEKSEPEHQPPLCGKGAAWLTLNALSRLSRPGAEHYWNQFDNQVPAAWKTGTSYGQKDGWAIGVNRQWTIGVWAGNFTGEGNAALSGARSAAPLMFLLFNRLSQKEQPMWFEEPEADLMETECCAQSGFPAGPHCPETVMLKRPLQSGRPGVCPYHKSFLTDKTTGHSVCSLCWQDADTAWTTRFIIPAGAAAVYRTLGKPVETIPRHSADCPVYEDSERFDLIYPVNNVRILIPRDYDGTREKTVFYARHQNPGMRLFWYLNGHFAGETSEHHELALEIEPGNYRLFVQDEEGFARTREFQVFWQTRN